MEVQEVVEVFANPNDYKAIPSEGDLSCETLLHSNPPSPRPPGAQPISDRIPGDGIINGRMLNPALKPHIQRKAMRPVRSNM